MAIYSECVLWAVFEGDESQVRNEKSAHAVICKCVAWYSMTNTVSMNIFPLRHYCTINAVSVFRVKL